MAPLLTLFLLTITALLSPFTQAQTCYYPDGTPSPVDSPCPNSDLCCPLNWQCLSNGLCYDPDNGYYDRRACTDPDWESEDCPDFCTYSEAGNEAIELCSNGEYCCNGNRVSFNCCDGSLPAGTDYFRLPEGEVAGDILESPRATASSSERESSSSSTTRTSSETTTDTTRSASTVESSTTNSESSTSDASDSSAASTVSAGPEVASTPTSAPAFTNPDDNSPFGIAAIIGTSIGVTILFLLCVLLAFLLYRRRKKSKAAQSYAHAANSPTEIKYSDTLAPGTHAPEIDSSPKAPTDGTSELYGSETTQVRNSTISSMTGGAGAQGYSPTSMVSPVVSGGGATPRMDQIEEKDEQAPVELWGGHVYRPYRPGLGQQAGNGV